jgi:hypothetical protein
VAPFASPGTARYVLHGTAIFVFVAGVIRMVYRVSYALALAVAGAAAALSLAWRADVARRLT